MDERTPARAACVASAVRLSISSAVPNRPTGRPGTDANGPFHGLAKRQRKQHFPNDHARVHASPCSRHVTRYHMIKDRHGTLTAPRRDSGTQTKRETDPLCSSIGFTSIGYRARLNAVSAPLLSNTTQVSPRELGFASVPPAYPVRDLSAKPSENRLD